ncbi:tRNA glutamyl-Q(34) synthetase GluQRS [Stenotrophomonas maltophilia]|uniref:tRNA glutamyl-Q(34) synthetase GluQRS n=1 Tax=Stenotrophomonas maltophilia TaxID=40324 RepID=UPI000B4E0786|nr:tRNA glutamyl-Q(34) synthetase GluQRS [Stenotrophomonas maltophilia]OWQ63638.1 tRNA glutamyl-Q(34) synthetase GluQRS [Stenotrophomonas maltophilia]
MTSPIPCGRFAPSPTGLLHPGSLLAAFGSWLLARHNGGLWRLRIEDVDPPRTVPGVAESQLRALAAFGLVHDGPILWQSTRGEAYQAALDVLLASHLAFVCHCSRSDLAANGGIHHRCVARQPRPDPAVRFRVPPGSIVYFDDGLRGPQQQDVHAEVGDFVLRRADGCWAYQLAVVVDDAAQGVTEVVRGADLLDSTARQILLQQALGLAVPRYWHLPLLLDAPGHKLSKSLAALPVDSSHPLPVLRQLWKLLGQAPGALEPAHDLDTLLATARQAFDPARLPRTDILLPAGALSAPMLQNPPSPTRHPDNTP